MRDARSSSFSCDRPHVGFPTRPMRHTDQGYLVAARLRKQEGAARLNAPRVFRVSVCNAYDWAPRYSLIVEAFDDTLAEYRRAARHPPCYIGFCPGSPPTSLSWS
jgi:hypothetical protein